jgi:signal transduction histidine kinase
MGGIDMEISRRGGAAPCVNGGAAASSNYGAAASSNYDGICVTISDDGGGMPEDIIDKIFEPYFTTKGEDKGTGIGLYMCKTIIEKNMGGSISAANVPGGARFEIVLSCAKREDTA